MVLVNIVAVCLIQPLYNVYCFLRFIAAVLINGKAAFDAYSAKKPNFLEHLWNSLKDRPLGPQLYSSAIGIITPYTGSIYPLVKHVSSTSVVVEITERPWLRNPFSTLHALALGNAAELASGILAFTAIEKIKARAIVNSLQIKFAKKARGTVTFRAQLTPQQIEQLEELGKKAKQGQAGELELLILVRFSDAKNEDIGTLEAAWQVRTL